MKLLIVCLFVSLLGKRIASAGLLRADQSDSMTVYQALLLNQNSTSVGATVYPNTVGERMTQTTAQLTVRQAYIWIPIVLAFGLFYTVMASMYMFNKKDKMTKDSLLYAKFLTRMKQE